MAHTNQKVLALLPEGSEVIDLIPNALKDHSLTVKYSHNGEIYYRQLTRISAYTIARGNTNILLTEGLTVNDIYDIYSKRFNLNLVKGEDYDDDETVVTEPGSFYLGFSQYSLRFKPSNTYVYLVDPSQALISDEQTRDLTSMDTNPFSEGFGKALRKLGTILFNGTTLVCFDQNLLTLDFRNLIISKIDENSEYATSLKDDILSAKIISSFNDGISDVILLTGKSRVAFLIRFKSNDGDIPILF